MLKSPRRIAPGGFVLFRKGVEVVVAVEPVGRATRTGAAQMQLPQKLTAPPQVFSCAALVDAPPVALSVSALQARHAFAEIIEFGPDFRGQCRSPLSI